MPKSTAALSSYHTQQPQAACTNKGSAVATRATRATRGQDAQSAVLIGVGCSESRQYHLSGAP